MGHLRLPPVRFNPLALIPATVTLVWALLVALSPLTLPPGYASDLSGVVGVEDNKELTGGMNPVARAVYQSGDINCHQRADRSLFINGNQMPYCSRCFGIFLGLAIGSVASVFLVVELRFWHIVAALAPLGVDGTAQLLGFWESTNSLRLLTGGLAGLVAGLALGYIFFALETILRARRSSRRGMRPGGLPGAQARPENAEEGVGEED